MTKNCPWVTILVWVPNYMKEFTKLCLPGISVRDYTEAKTKYNGKLPGITTQWNERHTPMRTHPVKYAFHVMADYSPQLHEINYLKPNLKKVNVQRFKLPEKYVVLQGAYTEIVKTMPASTFNGIKDYLLSKGLGVVCLGKTHNHTGYGDIAATAKVDVNYDFSNTINLIDKTSISESAKIIEGSKLFIGMDGGLAHLAGFTDVPIIAGYTFASHQHLMPIRNNILGWNVYPIIPPETLDCRFCQTKGILYYNHDFRDCLRGEEDYSCMKSMTVEKFIRKIEQVL